MIGDKYSFHLLVIAVLAGFFAATPARAEPILPYTTRTHGYSGWSSTVRGDIRNLSMAGAVVGLADTFVSSAENPAGIAMAGRGLGLQITGNRVYDGDIQPYEAPLTTSNLGVTSSAYPWGFSAGYWSPQYEGGAYRLGSDSGPRVRPEVLTQEFRFAAGRVFFDNKLALGGSFVLGRSVQSIEFLDTPEMDNSHTAYSIGASFGAIYQLPKRWLLGATYSFPVTYLVDSVEDPSRGVGGFFQPVKTPYRVGLGVGWLPNRFFRAGLSFLVIGPTNGVALLSDNSKFVGANTTVQPRIGAYYTFAEYRELQMGIGGGTYLETSRVQNTPTRLHVTGALEIHPWIFKLGWGIDRAPRYVNYIASLGLDLIKIGRKLDLIPMGYRPPPHDGFFPPRTQQIDDGLPRPLVKNWTPPLHQTDVVDAALEFPGRLQKKVQSVGNDIIDAIGIGGPTSPEDPLAVPPPPETEQGAPAERKPPVHKKKSKKKRKR